MEDGDEQRKRRQISWPALLVGAIIWFSIVIYISGQGSCVAHSRCGRDDLIVSSVLGVGYLGPAALVTYIASLYVGNFGSRSFKTIATIKLIGGILILILMVISSIHSFNVSEKDREDDISINRFRED
jgi:uncharacterized integral membrane protein